MFLQALARNGAKHQLYISYYKSQYRRMITGLYILVKTHKFVHLKRVSLSTYRLYLNKPDFKNEV